ncbi:MAG: hypothetical protein ACC628_08880, partial [Pirellulaceae bacterium]
MLAYLKQKEGDWIGFVICLSGAFAASLIVCLIDGVRVACDKSKERTEPPRPFTRARPSPAPRERSLGSSMFNIAFVTMLLCAAGYYGLNAWQAQ